MKVSFSTKGRIATFRISDYQDEVVGIGQVGKEINLINDHFRFILPSPLKDDPHPDLLALSVVAALLPYIKKPISFPKPVSKGFAEAIKSSFGIDTDTVDDKLKPRQKGSRTALAFSGGVDSVVCAEILPADTLKFTYVRMNHDEVEPRVDNFRQTTIDAVKGFNDVVLVDSDLEYISGPFLQWATWVALSIPGFILADKEGIGDIAYGLVAEGVYFRGMNKRSDKGFYDDSWQLVFRAAGLNMTLPTVGLTEFGNLLIADRLGVVDKTTPCQLGEYQKPCRECAKCFRKDFVLYHMGYISRKDFRRRLPGYMTSPKSRNLVLLGEPHGETSLIVHQEVYMYIFLKKWDWWPKPIRLFKSKVLLDKRLKSMDWVVRNDRKSFDRHNVGSDSYGYMVNRLDDLIDDMRESDYEDLYLWHDLPSFYARPEVRSKVASIDKGIEKALSRYEGGC